MKREDFVKDMVSQGIASDKAAELSEVLEWDENGDYIPPQLTKNEIVGFKFFEKVKDPV